MAMRVRSYSKINLGLAIGPTRPDGFHGLATLYQTLDLHDDVTVTARWVAGAASRIAMTTNNRFVPTNEHNTAWKMIEGALQRLGLAAEVEIHIEKRLPVRGGLGAGSANAVAALVGLERELGIRLGPAERLDLAAHVGSDVPLFLVGGLVLGLGRGEEVYPMPDLPEAHCVVAVPDIGVSTPQAFRDWDARVSAGLVSGADGVLETGTASSSAGSSIDEVETIGAKSAALGKKNAGKTAESALTEASGSDRLIRLSRTFASVLSEPHSSGVSASGGSLAEDPLLALVRTGIENDFEQVVFPQYPSLGDIKRILAASDSSDPEQSAIYAALSGSGSALFGLYGTDAAAEAAHERLRARGIPGFRTKTLPRAEYWRRMLEAGRDEGSLG